GDTHRGEHFRLLCPQIRGVEGDRFFHRGEREQLQQVVLDDVPCCPDTVVIAGAGTDSDVLGHGDLYVVDVVVVPDRFEHRVREPQREDVLNRFLAEVVVDAEHRIGGKHFRNDVVELPGGSEVVSERFFHHHPAPRIGGAV